MVIDSTIITKYFPDLDPEQQHRFEQLGPLYKELNQKINVISRKDIESIYLHHVLHSLSIAKYIKFKPETRVVDVGTGGGFPGIPLAIIFPETDFVLIDGRAKKITVVNEVKEALGLQNVTAIHQRSEELKGQYDFVLARAVTRLSKLIPLTFHLIASKDKNAIPNGLLALKGGNLQEEIAEVTPRHKVEETSIQSYFDEEYYAEKHLLYLQK